MTKSQSGEDKTKPNMHTWVTKRRYNAHTRYRCTQVFSSILRTYTKMYTCACTHVIN